MLRALSLAVVSAAVLAACTAGPNTRAFRDLRPAANPSAVIATELAFARTAQQKGQWTAFREYAARDAVMFVPQPVNAPDWLRRQQDPPQAVTWQPHQVWSSCDGSLAVTRGAWQRPDGSTGYFTAVWQRQTNGSYRWAMDQRDTLPQALPAPEMIGATVADCGTRPAPTAISVAEGEVREGRAADGSLQWSVVVAPDGGREVVVKLWQDGEMKNIVHETVAAEG